ncbi:molybdenum cofactor guanylyltransferase [Maribacter vaceletii]|uniref:Probable molybdenum cofactor guanylyltransferase n=1 Tax=Maribacter vaceletii TaxID=1206816 RepID=A0A495DSJ6_9FLAO|nr:NTP transferase domain-containing protein [Maribacter vaceletii]RKR07105.1 molybdenum cofactor guanylyltransferase [Maribacter vaceletii]
MILKDKIYGLVLSGGKSTRMGQDKGLLSYHGIPQREYLYEMLSSVCDKTFMSIRKEQTSEISTGFNVIIDKDEYKGPYNGLLSAYKEHPDVAWLVLACDLPLMNVTSLKELIASRNTKRNPLSTAFALKENPLPEPLCAIWEPEALKQSVTYLEAGNGSCPRKYLINSDVELVFPTNEHVLLNANSVEDYEKALEKIAVS